MRTSSSFQIPFHIYAEIHPEAPKSDSKVLFLFFWCLIETDTNYAELIPAEWGYDQGAAFAGNKTKMQFVKKNQNHTRTYAHTNHTGRVGI